TPRNGRIVMASCPPSLRCACNPSIVSSLYENPPCVKFLRARKTVFAPGRRYSITPFPKFPDLPGRKSALISPMLVAFFLVGQDNALAVLLHALQRPVAERRRAEACPPSTARPSVPTMMNGPFGVE